MNHVVFFGISHVLKLTFQCTLSTITKPFVLACCELHKFDATMLEESTFDLCLLLMNHGMIGGFVGS